MGTLTRAELGWRLQLVRGAIWQEALFGDEYAGLLRDFTDPAAAPAAAPAAPSDSGLVRSAVGAWLCTDPDVAARILSDPRFGVRRPDGTKPHLQVLPVDDSGLTAEVPHTAGEPQAVDGTGTAAPRWTAAPRRTAGTAGATGTPAVRGHVHALLDHVDPAGFDLITRVAEPLVGRVLGDLFGDGVGAAASTALAPVPDAMLTPPTLADALALTTALRRLRGALAAGAGAEEPLDAPVATCVLFTATLPTLLGNAVRTGEPDPEVAVDRARRTHPPLRLLCRVAHTDLDVDGTRIAEGAEVAIRTDVHADTDLLRLDPRYRRAAGLSRRTATEAVRALRERLPHLTARGLRRCPRSPVTARLARLDVTG